MKGTAAMPAKGSPGHHLSGKGRDVCQGCSITRRTLTSSQGEVNLYFGIHFHRLAIQKIRFILPLLYGIDGSRSQHWMPTDQCKVFDGAIFADNGVQHNGSLNTGLTCQRW